MSAEAMKENRSLKRIKLQMKMAKADKSIQSKRLIHYQRICKSVTSAKMALACKQHLLNVKMCLLQCTVAENKELNDLRASQQAQVESVQAENDSIEQQLKKQSEILEFYTMVRA
jgi:hypothetical protein